MDRYVRPYAAFKINNVWQDITADVEGLDGKSGMDISHGSLNQTTRISYGSCFFKMNNRVSKVNPSITSRYTPRNPSSDLYASLKKNIPFRTGIDRLVCNFGSTVSNGWGLTDTTGSGSDIPGVAWTAVGTASAFNVGSGVGTILSTGTSTVRNAYVRSYGELEVLVKFKVSSIASNGQFGIIFHYQATNEYRAFQFNTTGTDTLEMVHVRPSGSVTYFLPALSFSIVADTYYWMRVNIGRRYRVNVWPDSGAERTDGGWDGSIYDDGIDFGQTRPFGGAGPHILNFSNTTTLTVDYFDIFNPRHYGEVPTFNPDADGTGTYKFSSAESTGILRRLRVGEQQALDSPIYRMATKPSTLQYAAAYWTGEDTQGASTVSSGLTDGPAMTIVGGSLPTFGGETRMPGSKPMMRLGTGSLIGVLPSAATLATVGKIYFRTMLVNPDTELPNNAEIVRINTYGVVAFFTMIYQTGGSVILRAHDNVGAILDQTGIIFFNLNTPGMRCYFSIECVQNGGNIDVLLARNEISADGTTISGSLITDTFPAFTFGGCTSIVIGASLNLTGLGIGHIGVGSNQQFMFSNAAINGFAGETVGVRLLRLCQENNLDLYFVGANADTALCGPQQTGTLEYNLQLAADTDQGILFEPRGSLSVGYITRSALNNQLPAIVDYSADYFSESFAATDDDTLTANDATATSVSGGSARVIADTGPNNNQPPPTGIGVYHPSPPLNVMTYTQSQLPEIAGNRVMIGTWDAARFPKVTFNLARTQFTGNEDLRAHVLFLGEGTYLQVTNPPSWLPLDGASTVDLMTQGYKEKYGQLMITTTLNTTPYGPYLIGEVDSLNGFVSRVAGGTDIVLATGVDSSATSFDVISLSGDQRWCTATDDAFSAADFPMDAMCEGERVTITAVADRVNDPFTRSVSNGWGTTPTGETYALNGTVANFSVNGFEANIAINSVTTVRTATIPVALTNGEIYIDKIVIAGGVVAAGAPISVGLLSRFTGIGGSDSYLFAELSYATSDAVTANIKQIIAGVSTTLATVLVPGVTGSGTAFACRFYFNGSSVKFKVWNRATVEPLYQWNLIATTALLSSGSVGVWNQLTTGNTNTLPVTFAFDDFKVTRPQRLTVTRSVNSISKSHSANAPIDVVQRIYVGR